MDPDEALRRAREALKRLRDETSDSLEAQADQAAREGNAAKAMELYRAANNADDAAEDLADAFEALDDWLSKGGFLPQDWGKR